jgi:hypothetical protein
VDADILVIGRLCGALGCCCFEKLAEWSASLPVSGILGICCKNMIFVRSDAGRHIFQFELLETVVAD